VSKQKNTNEPSGDFAGTPASLYDEAIALLKADDPDVDKIAAILRRLDEPRPRELTHVLLLGIQEDRRLSEIIEAGEGQADRARQLERAAALLRTKTPSDADEAMKQVQEVGKLQAEQHAAWIKGNDAENARVTQIGLRGSIPRLFNLPIYTRGTVENITPAMAAFLRSHDIQVEGRDGWLFTKLVAPPATPRRRLVAVR